MNLAEFYGLQSIMDNDRSAADAVGRIIALVPATAVRLEMTIESLWAMDAGEAMERLAATVPTLLTDSNAADLPKVAGAMQSAFDVTRLIPASDDDQGVSVTFPEGAEPGDKLTIKLGKTNAGQD